MLGSRARDVAVVLATCAFGASLFACAPAAKKSLHSVADASDYSTDDPGDPPLPPPRPPDYDNPDSGALGAGERARDAAAPIPEGGARPQSDDGGVTTFDDAGTTDDGGPTVCPSPLSPGDLAIVEMMIQTQSGTGDRGEWVEIQNTRSCTLDLNGVHVESPRGTQPADFVDISYDLMLGPNETFIVADSSLSDVNHNLPGNVFSWIATDALKNDGDTVTVSQNGTTIDTLTYTFTAKLGRSVEFPVDCAWSARSDWSRWSWAFATYEAADSDAGVALQGTPNAINSDVACY